MILISKNRKAFQHNHTTCYFDGKVKCSNPAKKEAAGTFYPSLQKSCGFVVNGGIGQYGPCSKCTVFNSRHFYEQLGAETKSVLA